MCYKIEEYNVYLSIDLEDHLAFESGSCKPLPHIGHTYLPKVHPHEPIFAVAEKGENPPIIFYSWPDLEVKKVLRNGAAAEFNSIAFR